MKNDLKKRTSVGIFVTIGLALFIAAVYFIGKKQEIFGNYVLLNATFNNVSGLQEGSNVRFAGIVIGKVDFIEITGDSTVNVKIRVQKDVQKFIKSDSKASIGSEGLMGSRVLNISHGSVEAQSIAGNDTLQTVVPIEPDQILQSLYATANNAEVITTDMAEIFSRINKGEGAVGVLLNDPEFASTFEDAMKNIEKGTENFSENMKALQNNILFRSYFRKKEREKERQQKQEEKERLEAENQATKKKR